MSKKKKRKSKNHSTADDEFANNSSGTAVGDGAGGVKREEETPPSNKSSKRPREKDTEEGAEKKKKRKKSKSKKNKKGKETDENRNGTILQSSREEKLEGDMVHGQLVFIDRKSSKVFSATEVLENGERKVIGNVNADGKIVLLKDGKKEEEGDKGEAALSFPFETDPDDHCESPLQAYQDIAPFLRACGKPPSKLKIYDPYFCNGSVVKHLESLGFPNVYNRREDCYQVWASKSFYPAFDVFVTNPPYSADHIEKLMDHVSSAAFGCRPWMLLMPQWVHKKDYFLNKTKHIRPFYLVPDKRYVYLPPPAFREAKKSDVHKKSSPFVSMWYLWGGTPEQNDKWLNTIARSVPNCDIARSKSALRDLRRKGVKKK